MCFPRGKILDNKDEDMGKATMYLVYTGKKFTDTARKGSIHWNIMELAHREYNLRKQQPKLPKDQPNLDPSPCGHKTLNSLWVGLMDEKSKRTSGGSRISNGGCKPIVGGALTSDMYAFQQNHM